MEMEPQKKLDPAARSCGCTDFGRQANHYLAILKGALLGTLCILGLFNILNGVRFIGILIKQRKAPGVLPGDG